MTTDDPKIRALEEASRRSPDDVDLLAILAEAQSDAGRMVDAEATYKRALRLVPGRDDLVSGLSRALAAQGRHDTALAVLDAHVAIAEPGPSLILEHARLLLAADRVSDGAAQYRRAVEADPALADAFLARRLGVSSTAPPAGSAGGRTGAVSETTTPEDALRETTFGGVAGTSPSATGVEPERPRITFADVGGMEAVKDEVRIKIVHPMKNPELFRQYGKAAGGGILLYGPPGCGKTHLARATAGEVEATFLSVGIHDVLEMWIGQSERNLHAIFQQARRTTPAVLFFDEVDALGAERTGMVGAGRQVINQFLSELDGVDTSNDGVLVLAATNAPWHLDSAFRRPGRFDRVIFVPPPDLEGRARILEILCTGRPTDAIDFEKVARKTEAFSGADLTAVVDRAAEAKLTEAIASGKAAPIRTKDLLAAVKLVKPSTAEWLATVRNYVLYSNQGGLYDDVREYLGIRS